MEKYEIVIRVHDPAFDKISKKAVAYPKDQALAIWQEAKILKRPVSILDGSSEYQVSPTDVLQVRPSGGTSYRGEKVDVGKYKRRLIFGHKILKDETTERYESYVVFEICRMKRLQVGWEDAEYKEVSRMQYESWKGLSREEQDKFLFKLKEEHKLK